MDEIGIVEGLKTKIATLISRYETLRGQNETLAAQLEACRAELSDKEDKLKQQKQKLDNLQLTLAFTGAGGDKSEAKRKIARLIKDVDKCMEMLGE